MGVPNGGQTASCYILSVNPNGGQTASCYTLSVRPRIQADHIAFDGRIYLTIGDGETTGLQSTDLVLGRISSVHKRSADAVHDLRLADADGREDVITGTDVHLFWVLRDGSSTTPADEREARSEALGEWLAMADLEAGMVLRTRDGGEATVLGPSLVPGVQEVYNVPMAGPRWRGQTATRDIFSAPTSSPQADSCPVPTASTSPAPATTS